jgi:hypothetical protein
MDKAILPVSKFDAARRQLETAIRLYFFQGDPISIHTLASAAAQILQDLSGHRGGTHQLHYMVKVKKRGRAEAINPIAVCSHCHDLDTQGLIPASAIRHWKALLSRKWLFDPLEPGSSAV